MPLWALWAIGGGLLAVGWLLVYFGIGLFKFMVDAEKKGKIEANSPKMGNALVKAILLVVLGCVVVFGSCGLIVGSLL